MACLKASTFLLICLVFVFTLVQQSRTINIENESDRLEKLEVEEKAIEESQKGAVYKRLAGPPAVKPVKAPQPRPLKVGSPPMGIHVEERRKAELHVEEPPKAGLHVEEPPKAGLHVEEPPQTSGRAVQQGGLLGRLFQQQPPAPASTGPKYPPAPANFLGLF